MIPNKSWTQSLGQKKHQIIYFQEIQVLTDEIYLAILHYTAFEKRTLHLKWLPLQTKSRLEA
ncbi:hypothetical protein NUITMVRE36_09680 [Enterococcus raffinosus]|nr:hypothetical protein NUITMVRE36_09680 [Enterococcus raffinosus]